jgi:hypothetical protein
MFSACDFFKQLLHVCFVQEVSHKTGRPHHNRTGQRLTFLLNLGRMLKVFCDAHPLNNVLVHIKLGSEFLH